MVASVLYLGPELAVTATALAVLFTDVVLRRSPARPRALALLSGLGLAGAALALALAGERGAPEPQALFGGMLAADGVGVFLRSLFLIAAAFGVAFVATSDEVPQDRLGEYLALLLSLTLGLCLLVAAQNLLMIYLALELVSLPSYVLAGFRRGDRRSSEAALKYVIYGGVASGLMLYGLSLLYALSGSLDLALVGPNLVSATEAEPTLRLAAALGALFALAGFGYKVAAVPFHMWCPDVYEGAPTPFVAFLSVAPKAAGLAALFRFCLVGFAQAGVGGTDEFPWPVLLGAVAMATMTLGNLVAIAQDNVKRLLAYSSIAHAGYLLAGVAVGTSEGLRAVLVYLGIYLAMNLGAFLAVMVVRRQTGSENIADYRGLGSTSPYLAATLAIFLFSLTGLPPLAGFIGKFYLFAALLHRQADFFYLVAVVGVLNSAVSLYYYARVVKAMYLDSFAGEAAPRRLSSPHAVLLALLALPTLALGVWWAPLANAAERLATMLR